MVSDNNPVDELIAKTGVKGSNASDRSDPDDQADSDGDDGQNETCGGHAALEALLLGDCSKDDTDDAADDADEHAEEQTDNETYDAEHHAADGQTLTGLGHLGLGLIAVLGLGSLILIVHISFLQNKYV